MKAAKVVAWFGLISMFIAITNGFINGNFRANGSELLANPWGIVSLIDLYVGFFLFSFWIVFREKYLFAKIIWVTLMMILGFFTASLYVLITLQQSRGDWLYFFLGDRKDKLLKQTD